MELVKKDHVGDRTGVTFWLSTKSMGIKEYVWYFVKYGKKNINTEIKCKSMWLNSSQKLKLGKTFYSSHFLYFSKEKNKAYVWNHCNLSPNDKWCLFLLAQYWHVCGYIIERNTYFWNQKLYTKTLTLTITSHVS